MLQRRSFLWWKNHDRAARCPRRRVGKAIVLVAHLCPCCRQPLPDARIMLMARIAVDPNSNCWIWTGSTKSGTKPHALTYGRVHWRNRGYPAHRLSWITFNGPIPRGLCVCHRCDRPLCINPDHLFLGTYADNALDMYEKGRHPHGDKHGQTKIADKDIPRLLEMRDAGVTLATIAATCDVTLSQVHNIVTDKQRRGRRDHAY